MDRPITLTGQSQIAVGRRFDVWLGEWKEEEREDKEAKTSKIVVKILHLRGNGPYDTAADRQSQIESFLQEVRVREDLAHDNILPLLASGEPFTRRIISSAPTPIPVYYLVSPYCDKGTINDARIRPNYDPSSFIEQVASGLEYLHTLPNPIIHGNIRGENIFVTSAGVALLSGFSSARFEDDSPPTNYDIDHSIRWAAPELLAATVTRPEYHHKPTSVPCMPAKASDVYALGMTVVEIYTGRPPFSHLRQDPWVVGEVLRGVRPTEATCPEVPKNLWSLLVALWTKEPLNRPNAVEIRLRLRTAEILVDDSKVEYVQQVEIAERSIYVGKKRNFRSVTLSDPHFTDAEEDEEDEEDDDGDDDDESASFDEDLLTSDNELPCSVPFLQGDTEEEREGQVLGDDWTPCTARSDSYEDPDSDPDSQSHEEFREGRRTSLDLTGQIRLLEDVNAYFAVGGCGQIWRARWLGDLTGDPVEVALKVIHGSLHGDVPETRRVVELFKREFRVWISLLHPNIAPLYGMCEAAKLLAGYAGSCTAPALVTPFYKNGNVLEYIKQHPEVNRLELVTQIAAGMVYLHAQSVVHGDLKATNALVNDEGKAVIADFGLSRILSEKGFTTESVRGTVRWMAPELLIPPTNADGTEQVNVTMASDVWAFAMTVVEIFTGRVPYHHLRADAWVITDILMNDGRPTHKSCPEVPHLVWELLELCWVKKPELRPTMREVEHALRDVGLEPAVPVESV